MLDDRRQEVPKHAKPPFSWCVRPQAWMRAVFSAGEGILILLLFPPAAGYFFGVWLLPNAPSWLQWGLFVTLTIAIAAGMLMAIVHFETAWRSKDLAKMDLLPSGRCAACAFSLRGIVPEADGCTVCPECGCAWQVQKPAITDGKDRYVVDAAGSKRRPCPEFQRLRKKHREPRTTGQRIGLAFFGLGVVLIFAGLMMASVMGRHVPGLIVLGAGCAAVILTARVLVRAERVDDAIAAALENRRCPGCWGEFGPEQSECLACFATWRVQSADDD